MKLERNNIKWPKPCSGCNLTIADDCWIVDLRIGLRGWGVLYKKKLRQFEEWEVNSKIHGKTADFLSLSALLSGSLNNFFFPQKDFEGNFSCFKVFFELPSYTWCQRSDTLIWDPWYNPRSSSAGSLWSGHASNCSPRGFSLKETFV